jgi:hypothetical protein
MMRRGSALFNEVRYLVDYSCCINLPVHIFFQLADLVLVGRLLMTSRSGAQVGLKLRTEESTVRCIELLVHRELPEEAAHL